MHVVLFFDKSFFVVAVVFFNPFFLKMFPHMFAKRHVDGLNIFIELICS
jgi:hypothetical protein